MQPLTPARRARRRMWWRRFAYRRALERHPVSLTRQRMGLTVLSLLTIVFLWYAWFTRDEAIRSRAVEFLTDATSGEVSVLQAEFHLFGGITLYNVRISTHYDEQLDPLAKEPTAREIFSAASLKLVHNPWLLLFGTLHVEQVIATRPIITLVHNLDTGQRNWQTLSGPRSQTSRKGPARPAITVRDAKAVSVGVYADGRRDRRVEELDADVRPSSQSDSGYLIEVRRFSHPAERATVTFDPGQRILSNTPYVDARTVRLQLPRAVKDFFASIDLEGELKLDRMIYEGLDSPDRDTEIRLRNVRCRIPLAMLGTGGEEPSTTPDGSTERSSQDAAVALDGVAGVVKLRGSRLEVNIKGRLNDALCHVVGTVEGSERAPDQMGVDLTIEAAGVRAPEGDFRQRLISDSDVPMLLQSIFADYDPHGLFDLSLRIQRAPGPLQPVKLTGFFAAQGAIGTCAAFPYRVDELYGCIRFDSPIILVDSLTGRRGSARICVDAEIDQGHEWAEVGVNINAIDVALDTALYEVLPERYRAIWERFNPQGWANLAVRTTRPVSEEVEPEPPWTTRVTADLVGAHLLYTDFPYPLDDVSGRLHISGDEIQIDGLTGRHGDGTVQFEGTARLGFEQQAAADIQVSARGVRLDDSLASALPPEGRAAFEQFQPGGRFDLAGTIRVPPTGEGVDYDLTARLCDASIRYTDFPYPLSDVQGEIRISPDHVSVIDVTGRHEESRILARGNVRRLPSGYEAELFFDADDLALDDPLFDSLPPPLREVWKLLEPSGTVRVRSALHQVVHDKQIRRRHRTRIETSDAAFCFRGFPLPLTDVRADVVVSDERVEIVSLQGRSGDAVLRLSGTIELNDHGHHGSLVVHAEGLTVDDTLTRALPSKLRDMITSVAPTGTFSVELNPLVFELEEGSRGRWDVTCRIGMQDAAMNLGFVADRLNGELSGRVMVERDGGVWVQANVRLDKARLAEWELTDAQARITKEAGTKLIRVQDAAARAYGGEAIGSAEIRIRDGYSLYQASIYARDVALADFIASLGGSEESTAKGLIRGNMFLNGRSGPHGYREGVGEMFIQHAQVWRMPLALAIFQVLNLAADENVFHDGWIKYFLSRDTLTLNEIDLQGKAISFVGRGTMDLHTKQLDVTLLAINPMRLRLPLLTDLIEGASREFMEVRLRGTLSKPDIQPQPLKSLARALQTIFPEAPPTRDNGRSDARRTSQPDTRASADHHADTP